MFQINPKLMKQAMKKMGVKQEELDASEVIIKLKDKQISIKNPSVSKINMMGQESFQISGEISEENLESFNEEDIKTVVSQANCSEEEAKKALDKTKGDIAAAIIALKSQ
jgi:nascent polypeptide-associated complex subunit alpha